jgi:hypothetical protein
MRLYYLWQEMNDDYDTFDSCVVCAENEESAKLIHPNVWNKEWWLDSGDLCTWCKPEDVHVRYIGIASKKYKNECVIISSFNAG